MSLKELQLTINKLKILVSYANEEGELVELADDEIKVLNNALNDLTTLSEKLEEIKRIAGTNFSFNQTMSTDVIIAKILKICTIE